MTSRPARAEAPPEAWSGEGIAALAVECLALEVDAWPKPGLVSRIDSGSHADMDAGTFARSAEALRPHFTSLAEAGRAGAGMARLRAIGIAAETEMLAATGGVNTHRGVIFGLGLLCAAAGFRALLPSGEKVPGRGDERLTARVPHYPSSDRAPPGHLLPGGEKDGRTLGAIVATSWGAGILAGPVPLQTHGGEARRLYKAGGARAEAAAGFPTLYAVGLPALHEGRRLAPGDAEAAHLHCCFALVATLEDTNLLHRGGPTGLGFARREATGFLDRGGVGATGWREDALRIHRAFVARRLSPGGSADLLAMTLFADACEATA
ncbi:MAG: triphosphoribosyl-dephospho-CoA synthase [Janthinobacterium lividum]